MYPVSSFDENKVYVDRKEAMELLEYFHNCEIVQAAYIQVDTHLFLNGMSITNTDTKEDMNPVFMQGFNEEWIPFGREAAQHMTALGYCAVLPSQAVYQADGKNFSTPSPVLIPRDRYELVIKMGKDFRPEYTAILDGTGLDEPNPNIMVFVMPLRAPDPLTGAHRCLLKPLLPCYKNIRLQQMYNDMALQQRAHPPVFIERENAVKDTSNQPIIKSSYEARTGTLRLRAHEETVSEMAILPKKKPRLQTHWDNVNRYYDSRMDLFTQSHEDNMVSLPSGFKLCSGGAPIAEPPVDLLPTLDAYRDKVFALFGIPATIAFAAISTKNGSSSAIDLDDSDGAKLTRALRSFQQVIVDMMTKIFYRSFPTIEKKFKIKLRIFSPLSITQALTLDNMDMIGRKETQYLVLQRTGLDESEPFTGKNDHYRPIPGQNELMTTGLMVAREKEILAKANELEAKSLLEKTEAKGIKEEGYHPPKAPSSSS